MEPTAKAKYVAFETLYDPKQMPPGVRPASSFPTWKACAWTKPCIRWRCSASGMYGETLPNQNGAPIRLVVPWKYGFKSIKSIVKIKLRREAAADHLEYHQRPASTASTRT